jgi:hypothetical protein
MNKLIFAEHRRELISTLRRFWGFNRGDYSDCGLLSYDIVQSYWRMLKFRKNMLPPSSGTKSTFTLKMDVGCSSEMVVFTYETTRRHNAEDHNLI